MDTKKLLWKLDLQNFSDDESTEDDSNLDDTDVDEIDETENLETKTSKQDENSSDSEKDSTHKQSKKQNALEAQKRREREEKERKAKEKQIHDNAFLEGQLSVAKTNTFTNEAIKDEHDLQIFNLQKRLESEGKDPIQDLPKAIADMQRQTKLKQEQALKEKKESEDKIDKDIKDFTSKNPDVNIASLLQDSLFAEYSEGKLGNKPLDTVYRDYLKFKQHYNLKDSFDNIKENNDKSKKKGSFPNPNGGSSAIDKDYSSLSEQEKIKILKEQGLIN